MLHQKTKGEPSDENYESKAEQDDFVSRLKILKLATFYWFLVYLMPCLTEQFIWSRMKWKHGYEL
jgi:hypothetical protein